MLDPLRLIPRHTRTGALLHLIFDRVATLESASSGGGPVVPPAVANTVSELLVHTVTAAQETSQDFNLTVTGYNPVAGYITALDDRGNATVVAAQLQPQGGGVIRIFTPGNADLFQAGYTLHILVFGQYT